MEEKKFVNPLIVDSQEPKLGLQDFIRHFRTLGLDKLFEHQKECECCKDCDIEKVEAIASVIREKVEYSRLVALTHKELNELVVKDKRIDEPEVEAVLEFVGIDREKFDEILGGMIAVESIPLKEVYRVMGKESLRQMFDVKNEQNKQFQKEISGLYGDIEKLEKSRKSVLEEMENTQEEKQELTLLLGEYKKTIDEYDSKISLLSAELEKNSQEFTDFVKLIFLNEDEEAKFNRLKEILDESGGDQSFLSLYDALEIDVDIEKEKNEKLSKEISQFYSCEQEKEILDGMLCQIDNQKSFLENFQDLLLLSKTESEREYDPKIFEQIYGEKESEFLNYLDNITYSTLFEQIESLENTLKEKKQKSEEYDSVITTLFQGQSEKDEFFETKNRLDESGKTFVQMITEANGQKEELLQSKKILDQIYRNDEEKEGLEKSLQDLGSGESFFSRYKATAIELDEALALKEEFQIKLSATDSKLGEKEKELRRLKEDRELKEENPNGIEKEFLLGGEGSSSNGKPSKNKLLISLGAILGVILFGTGATLYLNGNIPTIGSVNANQAIEKNSEDKLLPLPEENEKKLWVQNERPKKDTTLKEIPLDGQSDKEVGTFNMKNTESSNLDTNFNGEIVDLVDSGKSHKEETQAYPPTTNDQFSVAQIKEYAKNFKLLDESIVFLGREYKKQDSLGGFLLLHVSKKQKMVYFFNPYSRDTLVVDVGEL